MRRTSVPSEAAGPPSDPATGYRPTEAAASTAPGRPVVITVSPRPDRLVIEVRDEDDVEEGLEQLRVELEALAYSSELV